MNNTTQTTPSELVMPSRNLDYARVERSLVSQLRDYCENAGQRGYVIGVSGGVDSAVVSTLCAKTGLTLLVLEMPIHQNVAEVNRAQEHIAWLKSNFPNVKSAEANLTEAFEAFKKIGEQVDRILGDDVDNYMSLVNTRSKHRMEMLYYIGWPRKLLVAGTGNKVEDYGIGFFTKYGDGGVDNSPIWDLYKSEVRELWRQMWVQSSLTEAIPTDGLHTNGATDEDQIGATYDELEWAMWEHDGYVDMATSNGLMHNDTRVTRWCIEQFSGRARDVMGIYTTRHTANAHKMSPPPVFQIPLGK
jgi:NAD+ synthase